MSSRFLSIACVIHGLLLAGSSVAMAARSDAWLRAWPQWRGPLANGVAPHANPPLTWSETNNVRWKIRMPGKGHASPVVYGDRVYVLSAVPVGEAQKPVYDKAPGTHDNVPVVHHHEFVAMAIARDDGQVLWSKTLRREFPHEGGHATGSLASNSPTTDGERA
jgi:outer membrane protein assembly factor BamB